MSQDAFKNKLYREGTSVLFSATLAALLMLATIHILITFDIGPFAYVSEVSSNPEATPFEFLESVQSSAPSITESRVIIRWLLVPLFSVFGVILCKAISSRLHSSDGVWMGLASIGPAAVGSSYMIDHIAKVSSATLGILVGFGVAYVINRQRNL